MKAGLKAERKIGIAKHCQANCPASGSCSPRYHAEGCRATFPTEPRPTSMKASRARRRKVSVVFACGRRHQQGCPHPSWEPDSSGLRAHGGRVQIGHSGAAPLASSSSKSDCSRISSSEDTASSSTGGSSRMRAITCSAEKTRSVESTSARTG